MPWLTCFCELYGTIFPPLCCNIAIFGVLPTALTSAKEKEKASETQCFQGFAGAAGGIRTLGRLLTVTRFPVVLVMTTSIPLRIHLYAGGNRASVLAAVIIIAAIFREVK